MPERDHSVMWSKDDPEPTPIHFVNIGSTEGERIRDLEEVQRDHTAQLADHSQVLSDIRQHLGELVNRIDKFRLYFVVGLVIIFGGTANGSKLIDLIGQLFT